MLVAVQRGGRYMSDALAMPTTLVLCRNRQFSIQYFVSRVAYKKMGQDGLFSDKREIN
jgi:hypothetical protein